LDNLGFAVHTLGNYYPKFFIYVVINSSDHQFMALAVSWISSKY